MILPLILIAPGHCSSRCGIFSNFVRLPDIRMGDGNRVVSKRRVALHMLRNSLGTMPGAGERHSTRDKDHEEGGSAYAKAGLSLRSPPLEILEHLPPNQSLPTFCFVLSPTPLTSQGGCPPLPVSEKRVSLQLQLIIPGCDSVSTNKLLWKSSSLPE